MFLMFLVVVQVVLVFLKIDGDLTWSWFNICTPSIAVFLLWVSESIKEYKKDKALMNQVRANVLSEFSGLNDAQPKDTSVAFALTNELLNNLVHYEDINVVLPIARKKSNGQLNQHQIAMQTATYFYNKDMFKETLAPAQIMARMTVLRWHEAELINSHDMMVFENILYENYK